MSASVSILMLVRCNVRFFFFYYVLHAIYRKSVLHACSIYLSVLSGTYLSLACSPLFYMCMR